MTDYRKRWLRAQLLTREKDGTPIAYIDGKTCSGSRWPEGEHYWIIQHLADQVTYHAPVADRGWWAMCPGAKTRSEEVARD